MSKYKKNKLKDLTTEYNKYTDIVNKEDFKDLDSTTKLSIKSLALDKASKLLEYIKKNFNLTLK